jgi:hypothetical protein
MGRRKAPRFLCAPYIFQKENGGFEVNFKTAVWHYCLYKAQIFGRQNNGFLLWGLHCLSNTIDFYIRVGTP